MTGQSKRPLAGVKVEVNGLRLRRRVTAPRDAQEAMQLIAKLEKQFGLISIEDQLMAALDVQRQKFETRERHFVTATVGTVLQQIGLDEITMRSDAFWSAEPVELDTVVQGDNITFKLKKEGQDGS